jgi:hypothetical protein
MNACGLRSDVWPRVLAAGLGLLAGAVTAATAAERAALQEDFTGLLTPDQYRSVIHDVFGADIKIGGRLDAIPRINGLMAVGANSMSVSPSSMEQYDSIARSIGTQVTNARHRNVLIPCRPKSADGADETCARRFFSEVGGLLLRRPLTAEELALYVDSAGAAAHRLKDFYSGLSLGLAGLLSAPEFLYRQETTEPDAEHHGVRLDAYAKAARLSFFLWDSVPDVRLLAAARNGELDTPKGLERQVDRMIASPRLEQGVRAFFSDMLHFDEFANLAKDTAIYPKFSSEVAADAREQTLRTLVDLLLTRRGDYRDVFTTKRTFMTKALAAIYRVPLTLDEPNGAPDAWQPYEFGADDPRAGILMQVSFVALNAHPGRSSPTLRGKALREVLLCERVPPPPGNVDFSLVQDTGNPVYKTARARLTAHHRNPVCAGCHKLIDPVGLALENFDGGGDYRTTENGVAIDTSGELDGVKFASGGQLGQVMHDNPATASCLVTRLAAYALGHTPALDERPWLEHLEVDFTADKYVVPALMRRIALSPEFYRPREHGVLALVKSFKASSSEAHQ